MSLFVSSQDVGTPFDGGLAAFQASLDYVQSAAWDGRWAVAVSLDSIAVPRPSRTTISLSSAVGVLIGREAPVRLDQGPSTDLRKVVMPRPMSARGDWASIATPDEAACLLQRHSNAIYCTSGGSEMVRRAFWSTFPHEPTNAVPATIESSFERRTAASLRLSCLLGGT